MGYQYDVAVVGAGPAGIASACSMSELGLRVLVLDEQARPGGQIYRNIEKAPEPRRKVLGSDYTKGAALVHQLRSAKLDYRSEAAVWQVEPDGTLFFSHKGESHCVKVERIVVATGAMERPVPFTGWTLPGVMGAGAANNLYKDSGLKPSGNIVIAGSGPLLLLEACQLANSGVEISAILETASPFPSFEALAELPSALRRADYLMKGVKMLWDIKRTGVPHFKNVKEIRAHGEDTLSKVTAMHNGNVVSFDADSLLVHFGVIPNTAMFSQLGCRHEWDSVQRYWYPATDTWGRTSLERVFAAGDGTFVHGAGAAELKGRLTALEVAYSVGKLSHSHRDEQAALLQKKLSRELAPRPFIDAMFAPNIDAYAFDDETLLCRCEHVTVAQIKDAVQRGCTNPNDIKALVRSGMGPCQGRMCGDAIVELLSMLTSGEPSDAERLRIRPPLKNVSMQEMASMRFEGGE